MSQRGHGIALFSGGLDSALAVLLILQQDIKVTALTFMTHFGCDITDKSSCSSDPTSMSEKFGFTAKMVHLGNKFLDIVKSPPHGHGKNMNPCIDCRILMLREAKVFMEMVGADFIFTGEVVGQRPMSQFKPQMHVVARESGLKGKLVRPLSAKLLPPTEPEISGILDREKLENISGRSRKRQMEMAKKFGLEDYPTPAAGCLLTDVNYSVRLRDLLLHQEHIDFDDLNLLKVGRHFRPDDETKIIVGRNEEENLAIERYRKKDEWIFEAMDTGSPLTLLKGELTEQNIQLASSITARYCDLKYSDAVEISYYLDLDDSKLITVAPQSDSSLEKIRI
jgi:tRNA U34 2-thiouridine synthase MnmA/TrmU